MEIITKNSKTCYTSRDPQLTLFVDIVESTMGILNYELWEKLYKEYRKSRSVYDLRHNFELLKVQVLRLIKECTCLTGDNNAYLTLVDSYIHVGNFSKTLYPEYPVENMDILESVYDRVEHLFGITSKSDREILHKKWADRNILIFYSDWRNLITSEKAARQFLDDRLESIMSNVIPVNMVQANNIYYREIGRLTLATAPIKKTSSLRKFFLGEE